MNRDIGHGLHILYLDTFVVVVDKPSGLAAQGTQNPRDPHVAGLVQAALGSGSLHHRLDRPASGLMVLAVHSQANKGLAQAFREHLAERIYLAVVLGDPGPEGSWDAPLDGKEARTHFRRLGSAGGMSVLRVQLETGRTHQIRRHAAGAGVPLAGDRRHGGPAGALWSRLALHAGALRLPHPVLDQVVAVRAHVPPDLRALVAEAGGDPEVLLT